MRILVTGSRSWVDRQKIYDALLLHCDMDESDLIIHGGAKGADSITEEIANTLMIPTHVVRPEYDYWTYFYTHKLGKNKLPYGPVTGRRLAGKIAPRERNILMLEGKTSHDAVPEASLIPDLVLAFFMSEKETGGTAHCVQEARKLGFNVKKFTS